MTTIDLSEPPRRARALKFFGAWTAVSLAMGVLFKLQLPHINTTYAFVNQALEWYSFAALSLVVWRVADRLSAVRTRTAIWIAAHTLLGILTIAVWQGLQMIFLLAVIGPDFWRLVYRDSWLFQIVTAVFAYGTMIGVTLALQSARREQQ